MYKIVTYIPEPDLETVKTAMFEAGAGHFGPYERCSWQTLGIGQFCPWKVPIQQLVKSGRLVRFLNGKWK